MLNRQLARRITPLSWVICAVFVWIAAISTVVASPGSTPPPAPAVVAATEKNSPPAAENSAATQTQKPQAPASNAAYVGEAKCAECHDQTIKGSAHGRAVDARTPAAKQGCESCHGPGSLHVADPTSVPMRVFKKIPAHETNETCTSCHNRGEHALWETSQHESRGLSCASCHSVHSPKSAKGQLKAKDQPTLCATCHRDKVAKLDRSGHMPVREGKMQCSTCHNTHGSTNSKLLRVGNSPAELCTSCHAEKRGPFLWEHAPSRDGCVTCHDPHGSSNERMLVAKAPLLCQRCHVATRHPATIYDAATVGAAANPSVRIFSRSCVECHSVIHGSNHPSGQRFTR